MAEDTPVKAVQVKLVLLGAFSVWIRVGIVCADVLPLHFTCPSIHVPYNYLTPFYIRSHPSTGEAAVGKSSLVLRFVSVSVTVIFRTAKTYHPE